LACYQLAQQSPHLHPLGLAVHIGSQISDMEPFEDAFGKMLAFVDQLVQMGIALSYIDLGGGYGIRYEEEQTPFAPERFFQNLPGNCDNTISSSSLSLVARLLVRLGFY